MSFEKMLRRVPAMAGYARTYETYYDAKARLSALGVALPEDVRLLEVQAPWAKMAVDVVTEILIPDGYIVGDEGHDDQIDLIRRTWQANNLDSQFNLAASEAITTGAAFWVMSPPDEESDFVQVRAMDSRHAFVRLDWRGRPVEGVAVYRLEDDTLGATYYTPDGVEYWVRTASEQWRSHTQITGDPWGISIVPMYNRARIRDRYGRSDLRELRPLIDAGSRTLTTLQLAQESMALPLRAMFGDGAMDALQSKGQDSQGEFAESKIKQTIGGIIGGPQGGQLMQLTGAQLDSFIATYRLHGMQISAMTGIPPTMMGIATDGNPTSAEALRTAKDRLITRAELKQAMFADALEEMGRKIVAMNGQSVEGLEALEVTWRDAAAPSVSAMAAAALQAAAQGVLSADTARDFLHLSPEQHRREAEKSRDLDTMAGTMMTEPQQSSLGETTPTNPADAEPGK